MFEKYKVPALFLAKNAVSCMTLLLWSYLNFTCKLQVATKKLVIKEAFYIVGKKP